MKNIFKLMIWGFFTLFVAGSVFAAGGLNLELVSQNPDPVNPGNFVFVSVKVSNLGTDSVSGAVLSFDESMNFKLAEGEDTEVNLGVIAGSNSVTKKFKILVGNNAPLGFNSLKFEIDSGVIVENTVDLLVGSSSSGLDVKDVITPVVAPGGNVVFSVNLENTKPNTLRNMVVLLNLDEVESKVFSLNSGTNFNLIGDLKGGAEASFSYDLIVSPDAESKPYLIPAVISYMDELGNEYTNTVLASVKVFSDPILSVYMNSQSSNAVGTSTFTFAIANPGTSSIKGTSVEVLDGDNYNILSGAVQYVGDLNPDDFQTVQSDIFVTDASVSTLRVKVNYLDSYNHPVEKIISVPVSIYDDAKLSELGLAGASSSGSTNYMVYVVALLLIIGSYYFGKRAQRKSHRK